MSSMPHLPTVGADFTSEIFARIGVDRYFVTDSAIGPVCVGWTKRGVTAIRRAGSAQAEDAFISWYGAQTGRRIVQAIEPDVLARAAGEKLADPTRPEIPLDLSWTGEAERAVLSAVLRIPRGYARPVGLLAHDVARVDSSAVETIVARNPIPLLVPCHRVIHAERCCEDDYVFGARTQAQLLATEGLDTAAIDRLADRGVRYIGSADGSFCLPCCGTIAARIDQPGYVALYSLAEARDRGLQPCSECRPVAA